MKRRIGRAILILFAVLLLAVLVGPFLVPVPPLEGTLPHEALADADSLFVELDGISVHHKKMGQGQPVFLLLHGLGASVYSWHTVMEPLSRMGTVIAFDRVGFGLTERPLDWQGPSPYGLETQIDLAMALLDRYGVERAILVGHSAGGRVAMEIALAHPERVSALILFSPAVYRGGASPGWLRFLFGTPQMRHLGPLLVRRFTTRGTDLMAEAWHDPSRLRPEVYEMYTKPFRAQNWDRALWEFLLASRPSDLAERLDELTLPVLVVTGDDDRIVPTAESVRLAGELPNAQLVVVPETGHIAHEENPSGFLEAVTAFMDRLDP